MGNPCIGDLLIQKALKVKSAYFGLEFTRNIQTFSEANLGNKPGVWLKDKVEELPASKLTMIVGGMKQFKGS